LNLIFNNTDIFVLPEFKKQALKVAGNNKKGILVVIRVAEPDQQLLSFLGKILKAVKINMEEDAHILNITNVSSISFSQINAEKEYKHLLSFGVSPEELGLRVDHQLYRPLQISSTIFLFANPLPAIFEERQQGKKKMSTALWKALQALFFNH